MLSTAGGTAYLLATSNNFLHRLLRRELNSCSLRIARKSTRLGYMPYLKKPTAARHEHHAADRATARGFSVLQINKALLRDRLPAEWPGFRRCPPINSINGRSPDHGGAPLIKCVANFAPLNYSGTRRLNCFLKEVPNSIQKIRKAQSGILRRHRSCNVINPLDVAGAYPC